MTTDLITKLQSVDLNAMAKRAYENAKRHGFHDGDKKISHWLCLVICELSDLFEYIEKKMTYNEHRPFKHGKEY